MTTQSNNFSSELNQGSVKPSQLTMAGLTTDREAEANTKQFQKVEIAKAQQMTKDNMKSLVDELNSTLQNENVNFKYHEDAESMYIVVTDKNTGDEIRKIPNEDALRLSAAVKEIGNILDQKG
jgi:flagellar protein FlaG